VAGPEPADATLRTVKSPPFQEATVHSSSQLTPTGTRAVVSGTRRRDDAYVLPHVRELPQRLEPVTTDRFGGPLASHPATRAMPTSTNPRGALS